MSRRSGILRKLMITVILAVLFICLIGKDRNDWQIQQPKGELTLASDVLILIRELADAGIVPADQTGYEMLTGELEETADRQEYIDYEMYCRIWKVFLKGETYNELSEILLYPDRYREEFELLEEDWYRGFEALLKYYDLQDVICLKRLEVLGNAANITGEKELKEGQILVTDGSVYQCLTTEAAGLSYVVIWAYVREGHLLTLVEEQAETVLLQNVWIMEADQEKLQFFYRDYELIADCSPSVMLSKENREQVGDLSFGEGEIRSLNIKRNKITGKILRLSENETEIEGYGTYPFDETCKGYRLFDTLKEAEKEELSIGYDFADFVIEDDKICSFLIRRKEQMESIRVLLRNNGFEGYYQEKLEVSCKEDMLLIYGPYGERRKERIEAGEKVILTKSDAYFAGDRVEILPVSGLGRVEILSLSRSQGVPSYRGKLEVTACEDGLLVINEVLLEEYLYSVVPSEMPAAYPMEALKAQAVCARTYAYRYLESPGLGNLGAHVDDSTGYQVYNNIAENVNSTKAVKETAGELLLYGDEAVSTYYYSTSCGYGADENVWKKENKDIPYLQPLYLAETEKKSDTGEREEEILSGTYEKEKAPERLCDEENFRVYITGIDEASFEKEEAWYRWSSQTDELDVQKLCRRLKERYQAVPDKILTYKGTADLLKAAKKITDQAEGKQILKEAGICEEDFVPEKIEEFDSVYAVFCTERLPGGVMNRLLLVTDKGTYQVNAEYNIRYVLCQGSPVLRQDGSVYESSTLLPSAYAVIQMQKEDGKVTGYQLVGGGYGHGVGMSQNGAAAMAKSGYKKQEILSFFFPGCRIEDRY